MSKFRYCLIKIIMIRYIFIKSTTFKNSKIDVNNQINIEATSPEKVDINKLLYKLKEEEKKQKKENLIFFGLISSVIVVTGIIASF